MAPPIAFSIHPVSSILALLHFQLVDVYQEASWKFHKVDIELVDWFMENGYLNNANLSIYSLEFLPLS